MSNPDRIDLRKLPPVEPLERRPSRLSQTALKHADACPRSGYLYLKHRGGALWALVLARVRKRRFDRGPMEVAA